MTSGGLNTADLYHVNPMVNHQSSNKATIKKKSLLNFRAIKNNYVVKQSAVGPQNSAAIQVHDQLEPSPRANLAQNQAQAPRRNAKIRASHSQFSDAQEANRLVNTGYLS